MRTVRGSDLSIFDFQKMKPVSIFLNKKDEADFKFMKPVLIN